MNVMGKDMFFSMNLISKYSTLETNSVRINKKYQHRSFALMMVLLYAYIDFLLL